jgi:acetylornithine deacetylase
VLDAGFGGDAAISAEPTVDIRDGTIDIEIISCRAVLLKLTVVGKATHVGFRNELIHAGGLGDAIGVSAIEKAIFVMEAIARLEGNWARVSRPPFPAGKFILHPGVIHGGPSGVEIPYVIPDSCTIDYSVWFDPSRTHESIQAEIEDYVLRACSLDPWLSEHPPQFVWYDQYGHHEIAPDAPLVQALAATHRSVAGADVRLRAGYASGDGVVLFESGIPTLVYGPGNLARAHAANEYIDVDELMTATKVWALTTAAWCGVHSTEPPRSHPSPRRRAD